MKACGAVRHQRADGAAILSVHCDRGGHTRVRDLYQRAPCRLLFPDVEAGEPLQAVLLTTTGGLTGGDRTQVQFTVGANARATLTTQAAEKLYRALPDTPPVACTVAVTAGPDSWCEWLAQETILFDGARLRRSFRAELAVTARLLAVESVIFGRHAMGEELRTGMLHDCWRIRRAGRLVWADTLRLEGNIAALRAEPFGFGAAVGCATMVYAGQDAADLLEPLRELLAGEAAECGVTLLDELLIIRMLDRDAPRLRARVVRVAGLIRQRAAGVSCALPRIWHC